MPRIYYNTGVSGRSYSHLYLQKYDGPKVDFQVRNGSNNTAVMSVCLDKTQIQDLIYQLGNVLGINKLEPPLMEGSL